MLVEVDQIKPGALIKSEIRDNSGKVVFKAGTKATPLLLKRLITWGIKSIEIESEESSENAESEELTDQIVEKKSPITFDKEFVKKIARRFSNVKDDELMNQIMRLAIKHLSERQLKK